MKIDWNSNDCPCLIPGCKEKAGDLSWFCDMHPYVMRNLGAPPLSDRIPYMHWWDCDFPLIRAGLCAAKEEEILRLVREV